MLTCTLLSVPAMQDALLSAWPHSCLLPTYTYLPVANTSSESSHAWTSCDLEKSRKFGDRQGRELEIDEVMKSWISFFWALALRKKTASFYGPLGRWPLRLELLNASDTHWQWLRTPSKVKDVLFSLLFIVKNNNQTNAVAPFHQLDTVNGRGSLISTPTHA